MTKSSKGTEGKVQSIVKTLLKSLGTDAVDKQLRGMDIVELDRLERKLQIAASVLRGHRNRQQSINRLPPELLFIIFRDVQENLPRFLPLPENNQWVGNQGLEWYSLIGVCRHWRAIFASTPSLWSTVDNRLVPELCLKRSRNAPLDVFLNAKGPEVSDFDDQLMEALQPHSKRFREFHLYTSGWKSSGSVYSYMSKPAPILESLSIMNDGPGDPSGILPSIFNDEMPVLKKLTLSFFTSWPSNYFQNLTHLCLCSQLDMIPTSRSTTAEFLDFLEQSPLLQNIVLIRAGPTRMDVDDHPAPAPGRIVSLDHLVELSFGDWLSPPQIARLLGYLSIPSSAGLYIWGHSTFNHFPPNPTTAGAAFLPSSLTNLANFAKIKECRLIRQPNEMHSELQFLVANGCLCMIGFFSLLDMQTVAERCDLTQVETLVVRDAFEFPLELPMSAWRSVFKHLPAVKNLHIMVGKPSLTSETILLPLHPTPEADTETESKPSSSASSSRSSSPGPSPEASNETPAESQTEPKKEDSPQETEAGGTESPEKAEGAGAAGAEDSPETTTGVAAPKPLSILCPDLESICIEHDMYPPSLQIADMARVRTELGHPLRKFSLLRYDPYLFDPANPSFPGAMPRSPSPSPGWAPPTPTPQDTQFHEEYRMRTDNYFRILKASIPEVVDDWTKKSLGPMAPSFWPTDSYTWAMMPPYPPSSPM